jgi:alanine racemase
MSVAASKRDGLRTWVELSRSALAHNLRTFRHLLGPNCRIMAVAKSNAYGHGLYDLVPLLEELGVDAVGVDSIVEAATLRRKGVTKPILVMGFTLPSRFGDAARNGVAIVSASPPGLARPKKGGRSGSIKVDMRAPAGPCPRLPGVCGSQVRPGQIAVEASTPFRGGKEPARPPPGQIAEFEAAAAAFAHEGFETVRHACATAGVLNYPEAHYDMARIGIGLVGHWPSAETQRAWEGRITLRPVLSWRTLVSETKLLPAGAPWATTSPSA